MSVIINHPAPSEGVHHTEENVSAYFKEKDLGKGTLYIAESVLCWVCTSGQGFALPYSSIYIHAVCKDLTHFPKECIYLNVDGSISLGDEEQNGEAEQNGGGEQNEISNALGNLSVNENGEGNNVEDDYEPVVEIRFVPDNTNMLDVMFRAISDCQALNPDPNEKSDDDDGLTFAPHLINFEENGIQVEYGEGVQYDEEEDMNEDQFEDADS